MENNDFLGRGWAFPVTFSKGESGAEMVEKEEDIRQSLEILLATIKGERVMRPDYGANMDDLVFEPLTVSFARRITERIENAILFHEPRVKTNDVNFIQDTAQGLVQVRIDYTILATNNRRNLVFPFYQNEATDVPT